MYFLKGDFPNVQFPKRQLPLSYAFWWCNGGGRALRLEQAKGPSTAVKIGTSAVSFTGLESCRLGNRAFGKLPLVKIPLESCRLGKYPTSFIHPRYIYLPGDIQLNVTSSILAITGEYRNWFTSRSKYLVQGT